MFKFFLDKKWTRSYDETESRTYENIIQYRKFAYVRSQSEPRKKSDVIPIESLKPFRKMLNRWKSKEKKSSSGDGSGSKRKRKFGREGLFTSFIVLHPIVCFYTFSQLFVIVTVYDNYDRKIRF